MATYYIDYSSGSDANAGTSTGAPWQRHPYMNGFSGTYTHAAGDHFIFKGGVTWPAACFPLTQNAGGSAGNSDYYGFDVTWYSGGSWSRPLFDMNYASISSNGGMVLLQYPYVTLDNFEICHLTIGAEYVYLVYIKWIANVLIKNCHIHGWVTNTGADGLMGGVANPGPLTNGGTTVILDNCEVENSENASLANASCGACIRGIPVIQNGSRIHDNCQLVDFCADFNGSYLYNAFGNSISGGTYHTNGLYHDPGMMGVATGYIRNSYIHDVYGGANSAYPNISYSSDTYIYNNVIYGAMTSQGAINLDPYYASGGSCYIWNNTIVPDYSSGLAAIHLSSRTNKINVLAIDNTHLIATNTPLTDAGIGDVTTLNVGTHNLTQTPAVASGQGYTLASLYGPTSAGSTIDAGTSEAGYFTTDILGTVRPQGSAWDIGAYEYFSNPPCMTLVRH